MPPHGREGHDGDRPGSVVRARHGLVRADPRPCADRLGALRRDGAALSISHAPVRTGIINPPNKIGRARGTCMPTLDPNNWRILPPLAPLIVVHPRAPLDPSAPL